MKTHKILLALSAILFLLIIPITLFSVYLYKGQPVSYHKLLFQRIFSQYEAYAYNRSEETCNYLEGQFPSKTISCTRKFINFTIYIAEKTEKKKSVLPTIFKFPNLHECDGCVLRLYRQSNL